MDYPQRKLVSLPPVEARATGLVQNPTIRFPSRKYMRRERSHDIGSTQADDRARIEVFANNPSPVRQHRQPSQIHSAIQNPNTRRLANLPPQFDEAMHWKQLLKPYVDISFDKIITIMKEKSYVTQCGHCARSFVYKSGELVKDVVNQPRISQDVIGPNCISYNRINRSEKSQRKYPTRKSAPLTRKQAGRDEELARIMEQRKTAVGRMRQKVSEFQKHADLANQENMKSTILKEKEILVRVKQKMLRNLSAWILESSAITIKPEPDVTYTYYLGQGNNSRLLRKILNSRPWWKQSETGMMDANFLWTQGRKREYLHRIPRKTKEILTRPDGKLPIMRDIRLPKNGLHNVKGELIDFRKLGFESITDSPSFTKLEPKTEYSSSELKVHAKIEKNFHLANKKALFCNMKKYYTALGKNPFDYLPLTFHVRLGVDDGEFLAFKEAFAREKTNGSTVWIVKPGEYTNQGVDIVVCSMIEQVQDIVRANRWPRTGLRRTHIIQKYIHKPLLIHKRKFDIRLYSLMTCFNGVTQGYFYIDGYLRTSCKEFNINNIGNRYIHLTNDAIQKHSEDYGKFEFGNKLSYAEFQRYIDFHMPAKKRVNFMLEILPKIKAIVKDTMEATYLKLDINRRQHTFELFGYDFMIDSNWQPWLIECNTNPCLALSSPYLQRLIPDVLENMFKIAIDPIFPEPVGFSPRKLQNHEIMAETLAENRFELIFHEETDGPRLVRELGGRNDVLLEEDPCLVELSDEEADEEQESDEDEPE